MTDKHLSLSVIGGAVLISAAIVWHGTRWPSHARSAGPVSTDGLESPRTSPSAAQPTQPAPTAPQKTATIAVAFDLFDLAWKAGPGTEALQGCWKPLEAKYGTAFVDPTPQFTVSVDETGTVMKVEPEALRPSPMKPEATSELNQCLMKVIRTMKLRPSGAAGSGRVQASRPEG